MSTTRRLDVLVVDDELAIRQALRMILAGAGFDVNEASTGEEAIELVRRRRFDAILLDMNMPGMGGMRACKELRRIAPNLPILMLTVRDEAEDKVEALEGGADDYVTKPFHMGELTARLRAAVRRASTANEAPDASLRIGEISLDPERRVVHKGAHLVRLTPKEFDLLLHLMMNSGRPIAHRNLLTAVWGADYGNELEYLRTFIHQLRKKLEDDPSNPQYLLTETWFGYRFRES